jgi:NAD(P)-dependent dehydrogenase (short-subunit alcohol dehydrogenase family)
MAADSLRTFAGATAVITGGASGIGRALGEALAHRGASVVLADRQLELAQQVAAGIRDRGGQATAEELDVTDPAAVRRVVEGAHAAAGRLDYMFNNAGIGVIGEVQLYRPDDWSHIVDVNLGGVIHGIQAAYPLMLRQGFGHIVNTASLAGLFPYPLVAAYCATKHAVVGLSTSLRLEAAAAGVRVSVLCPGPVRTPALVDGGKFGRMLQPMPAEALRAMVDRQRPITAERFAEQAVRAVARNRAIVVIPGWWKLLWWVYRLSPGLGLFVGRQGLAMARKSLQPPPPSPGI